MKNHRKHTLLLSQGWALLVVTLALCVAVKLWVIPWLLPAPSEPTATSSAADQREIEEFERNRLRDSLHRAQQWAAARQARQQARAERERAYEEQRAIWAEEKAERAARRAAQQARYDSLVRSRPQKLPKGVRIDANAADTTQWQRVPGVGRVYAQAIVRYRQRLGGFANVQQLHDIAGLPYDIDRWVAIAPRPVLHRINVNRASFKELLAHPYLNFEQVKAIVRYRQKVGNLRTWDDMKGNVQFSDRDLERLLPYFSF